MGAAELDHALGDSARILLDSSALIAFHSPHERAYPLAQHLLQRIAAASDPLRGYYSVVSAVELLVRPIRSGPTEYDFMHTFLTQYPMLTALPVDLTVALQAASLRAASRLPAPDAIVVASGLLAGCEAIVTNDAAWKQRLEPLFRAFRWITLEDYC